MFQRQVAQDRMRKQNAAVNRVIRELEREKFKMVRQEQRLIFEMKKMAKLDQTKSVKILANDLIKLRKQIQKLHMLIANFRGLTLKLIPLRTYGAIAETIGKTTLMARSINLHINLPRISNILHEFENQIDICDVKLQNADEQLEGAFDDDENEETDDVVYKVLDELGLLVEDTLPKVENWNRPEVCDKLSSATTSLAAKHKSISDEELETRFKKLRG